MYTRSVRARFVAAPHLTYAGVLCVALCIGMMVAGRPAHAEALTRNDFAEGLEVLPVGDAAVQRIELPMAVYAGVVRNDLGDLRVFDPAGAPVPYSLVARTMPAVVAGGFVPLALFPLPATALSGSALNVRVDTSGAVVSVQGGQPAADAAAGAYLVDALTQSVPLRELQLSLAGAGDVVGSVRIESSQDLQQFSTLVQAAPVARLTYAGRSLQQLRITLPETDARYLRLTLRSQGGELALRSVHGRRAVAAVRKPSQSEFAQGVVRDNGLEFDLSARIPVVGVAVDLMLDNSFLEARLLCGDADPLHARNRENRWSDLGSTSLYRLRRAAVVTRNPALPLATVGCRRVRIEALQKDVQVPAAARIKVLWTPAELWFIRRGDGAHVIAFGSTLIAPAPAPLAELMRQMQAAGVSASVPTAQIGRALALGGAGRRTAAAPVDWRKGMLWGVLVGGVVLVVVLAWRVLREQPQS